MMETFNHPFIDRIFPYKASFFWGYPHDYGNPHTVDGCEILHHQPDGWNHINDEMFTTVSNWCRISQPSTVSHDDTCHHVPCFTFTTPAPYLSLQLIGTGLWPYIEVVTSHAREPLHLETTWDVMFSRNIWWTPPEMVNLPGKMRISPLDMMNLTAEKVIEPAKIKTTRWIHVHNSKTGWTRPKPTENSGLYQHDALFSRKVDQNPTWTV